MPGERNKKIRRGDAFHFSSSFDEPQQSHSDGQGGPLRFSSLASPLDSVVAAVPTTAWRGGGGAALVAVDPENANKA